MYILISYSCIVVHLIFQCNLIQEAGKILFLSDEGPMLETLDYTTRIGSTSTFLYFNFINYI